MFLVAETFTFTIEPYNDAHKKGVQVKVSIFKRKIGN